MMVLFLDNVTRKFNIQQDIFCQVAGTQTAALGFGGYYYNLCSRPTEEYNGATWASGGSYWFKHNKRRYLAGAGITNSRFSFWRRYSTWNLPGALRKNMMEHSWVSSNNFKHSKISFRRCWYSNSSFSFWW
jgi:hypothetical protein